MTGSILDEARLFLMSSLQGKQNSFESKYAWRRGWEFAVLHSLRVETYAMKILALEQGSLSEHGITLLRLAAILYDLARLDKRENHAKLGAEMAKKWLRRYHRTGDYEQSLSMLRSAVEIDPEFAMAYRAMAVDARNLGYFQREAEYVRKAFELSGRLPEDSRERRLIRADYYSLSEATLAQAAEEFRKVLDDHP